MTEEDPRKTMIDDPRTEEEIHQDFEDTIRLFENKMMMRRTFKMLLEEDECRIKEFIETVGYRNFIIGLNNVFGDRCGLIQRQDEEEDFDAK